MIHPTRTNLLLLRDKVRSVVNSLKILKARKQALIKEFLDTTRPFLRSRAEIRNIYGKAVEELRLSIGHEGKDSIESIAAVTARDLRVEIAENSIWGLKYKEVRACESAVRDPRTRGYDYLQTTHHLEEGIYLFEKIVEAMIEIAAFESKLKRLGDEITSTTRKIKVIEERVMPELRDNIKTIMQYIGEREREAFYRLKRFKSGIQSIQGGP